MLKKLKPHHFHLGVGIIFFIISFLPPFKEGALDIAVHDTYYVIGMTHFFWVFFLFSSLAGLFYYLISRRKRKLRFYLHLSHVIIVFVRVVCLFITLTTLGSYEFLHRGYYDNPSFWYVFNVATICGLSLIIGTLFLILNLAFSKKGKT